MSSKILILFALLMLLCTFYSNVLEMQYMDSDTLTVFKLAEGVDTDDDGIGDGVNWFSPSWYVLMFNFVLKLITFDYAFFRDPTTGSPNELMIVRIILSALAIGLLIPFALYVLSMLSGIFTRFIGIFSRG